jgi:hypothetical protein
MLNRMRKFCQRAGGVLLAISTAVSLAVVAAPQANAAWGDIYTLTPRHSLNYSWPNFFPRPHCLDVGYYSIQEDAPVVSAQCAGTLNQLWTMTWSVSSNNLILRTNHNPYGNKCLDVAGRSQDHAAQVVQHTCDNGPSQIWQAIYLRSVNGVPYYLLQNSNSHLCLDVAYYGTANGTPVVQANCMGTDNQIWDLFNTRTTLHGV